MARKRKSNKPPLKKIFQLNVVDYLKTLGIQPYEELAHGDKTHKIVYLYIRNAELKNALDKYTNSSLIKSARSCTQGELNNGNDLRYETSVRVNQCKISNF